MNMSKLFVLICLILCISGCAQYRCYDGTYVEDAYNCFNHGGLSYYSNYSNSRFKRANKNSIAGIWNFTGEMKSNSCGWLNQNLTSKFTISQIRANTLSLRAKGLGTIRSTKYRKRNANFNFSRNLLLYKTNGNININFSRNNSSASINGTGNFSVLGSETCDISFSSKATKEK
jgi:hypothetical protein